MGKSPRPIQDSDLAWVHALNQAHRVALSSLSRERLEVLLGRAFLARVVDDRAAFMLTFDQDADYDSPNFLWFKGQLARFVYVDRVVVSPDHRRQGLAGLLYDELFRFARDQGTERIVCEVNADPPNPGSDAFHAARGFTVMGQASLADRAKSVRYLVRDLA